MLIVIYLISFLVQSICWHLMSVAYTRTTYIDDVVRSHKRVEQEQTQQMCFMNNRQLFDIIVVHKHCYYLFDCCANELRKRGVIVMGLYVWGSVWCLRFHAKLMRFS